MHHDLGVHEAQTSSRICTELTQTSGYDTPCVQLQLDFQRRWAQAKGVTEQQALTHEFSTTS